MTMDNTPMTPGDYWEILKRRKWSLVLTFLIVFLVAAIVALALPSIYQSTSTILIEEQEIPPDYVMTTVTSRRAALAVDQSADHEFFQAAGNYPAV